MGLSFASCFSWDFTESGLVCFMCSVSFSVQHCSDPSVADKVTVGQKKNGGRQKTHKNEFKYAGEFPIRDYCLQDFDERKMSDVKPVGRI